MVVTTMKCTSAVACRIQPALQYYANNEEHVGEKFNVSSHEIDLAFAIVERERNLKLVKMVHFSVQTLF